jgi:hypothetical protein
MNHIVPIIVPISGSKIVLSREPVPNSIQLVNYKKIISRIKIFIKINDRN